ncbi:TldD/PmbA family protein [bacterium]|nr:TldD/PmbA family protein [bacterium]
MRTKEEIKGLLTSVLAKVTAPQAQAEYYFGHSLATRFGENAITQNMGGEEENIRLITAYDKKHGSSITNKLQEKSLTNLVKRAEDIAKNSPEDPEYMPPVKPQEYPDVPPRFFKDVTELSPEHIAKEINKVVQMAKGENFKASGLFEANYGIRAIANSEGLFAYDKYSGMEYSTTFHGPRGSGSATESGEAVSQVNAEAMASRALDTAISAQNPQDIEPGDYTVIFEPQAVIDFLGFFAYNMTQRDADEGTTVFAGKVGEKLFGDKVTLTTELDDPELPAPPYGLDGLPVRRTTWVENGVVKRLRHDRFWAAQKNTEPDPVLYPIFMEGEDRAIDDLVSMCEKGVLVKRLWYIRYVDRKELLLTGMTRDGFFLVEDGKIVAPVKNLRFNESPVVFLSNIVAMSKPQRVGSWAKVPAIMSRNFTFSSKTESV